LSFLGDFEAYLRRRTDAPPDFHIHAGMVALATALGNRVKTWGWTRDVYPNLWVVIIAPSGYGKAGPLDMAERMIRKAELANRLLPDSFSLEALVHTMKAQPVGTFITQEFASFVAMMDRDYNAGCRQFLAKIYDSPEAERRVTMKGEVVIERPCLSILGASSPSWFAASLRGSEDKREGGFLERIIFCPSTDVGEPVDDPGPPEDHTEAGLAYHLREVAQLHGVADFTEVNAAFSTWQRSQRTALRAGGPQEFGGMRSRAPLLVKKAAILFHVSSDPRTLRIKPRDLQRAIDYVEHSQELALDFLQNQVATTPDEALRIKIVENLRRAGGRQNWSDALRQSKESAFKFKGAIDTLEQSGRVARVKSKAETGYSATFLVLGGARPVSVPNSSQVPGNFPEPGEPFEPETGQTVPEFAGTWESLQSANSPLPVSHLPPKHARIDKPPYREHGNRQGGAA
jgi:hypothetical protein